MNERRLELHAGEGSLGTGELDQFTVYRRYRPSGKPAPSPESLAAKKALSEAVTTAAEDFKKTPKWQEVAHLESVASATRASIAKLSDEASEAEHAAIQGLGSMSGFDEASETRLAALRNRVELLQQRLKLAETRLGVARQIATKAWQEKTFVLKAERTVQMRVALENVEKDLAEKLAPLASQYFRAWADLALLMEPIALRNIPLPGSAPAAPAVSLPPVAMGTDYMGVEPFAIAEGAG